MSTAFGHGTSIRRLSAKAACHAIVSGQSQGVRAVWGQGLGSPRDERHLRDSTIPSFSRQKKNEIFWVCTCQGDPTWLYFKKTAASFEFPVHWCGLQVGVSTRSGGTSMLRQRKGRAPPTVTSRDNHHVTGGLALWGGGVSSVCVRGGGPRRRHIHDSIRPSRLRSPRPKKSLRNKVNLCNTDEPSNTNSWRIVHQVFSPARNEQQFWWLVLCPKSRFFLSWIGFEFFQCIKISHTARALIRDSFGEILD